MSVTTVTHLNFDGDARAALEHYRSVFGGELTALTYEDAHQVAHPDDAPHVMWGQVVADNGFRVMAYDVQTGVAFDRGERAFFVSLRGDDADEVTRFWTGLADGGTVEVDLGPAAWSPLYGMVTDRFGVTWVVDVAPQRDATAG